MEEEKGWKYEEEDVSRYWMTKLKRGCWKLREAALDRTLWRTRCGRGYERVVRQTKE
jgi:hypothetical protein